ncbi:MAG: hypothetical protein IJ343_10405 [Clostridia bacterium]|nr:hypothetical protein [Clostridia bacterium]
MSQAPNQSPSQQTGEPFEVQEILDRLIRLLTKDWGSKLLSVALAVALWAGLITQDPTLTREKTFRDVTVSITGADTLKRNGFVVVGDVEALLDGVTVVADVPQKQYVSAQASNYNVRLDLSRIRQAGEQEVAISATSTATYGTVLRISPARVNVQVEEYVNVGYIPVNAVLVGNTPEGFHVMNVACDPSWLTVSGPRSVVEKVVQAEITLDKSQLPAREGDVRLAAEFRLLDGNGQEISDETLQVTSESVLRTNVNLTATMYTRRDIDLTQTQLYIGSPADGYEVTDVIVSPEVLSIAGERSKVERVRLFDAGSLIRITGAKDNVEDTVVVKEQRDLPWISDQQLDVTVVIQPVLKTRSFQQAPIELTGVPQGMTAVLSQQTARVDVTGAEGWVDGLAEDAVRLRCDVKGLTAGVHETPLQVLVSDSEGQNFTVGVDPMTVNVTIAPSE